MKTGKVKFYNAEKGFGFIIDNETSKDVFVHRSGLIDTINEMMKFHLKSKMVKKDLMLLTLN